MAPPSKPGSAWSGVGTAWNITGTLLAGLTVWGGIGYLVDRWLGWDGPALAVGLLVGIAGGIYLVYVRYGRDQGGD